MVRRVGFGDGDGDRAPAVRRRGERREAAPESGDPRADRTADRSEQDRPAAGPWGARAEDAPRQTPSASEARRAKSGISIAPLIMLAFVWIFILNLLDEVYGGVEGLLWRLQDLASGRLDAAETLAPLAPASVFALIATLFLLRRAFR